MNTYEFKASALCPVNPSVRDEYDVRVVSLKMIQVERLLAYANLDKEVFQEDLTAMMADDLDALVTLTGVHSGVKVISSAHQKK